MQQGAKPKEREQELRIKSNTCEYFQRAIRLRGKGNFFKFFSQVVLLENNHWVSAAGTTNKVVKI